MSRAIGTWQGIALIAVVVLGVAAGALLGRELLTSKAGPEVMVDVTVPVGSDGALVAFTISEGMTVRAWAHLENCTSSREATLGPLVPAMRPHLVYETAEERSLQFTVHGRMEEPLRHLLPRPGVYAVRVPAIPVGMGPEELPVLHVLVERETDAE